jgi:hypothetical protein
VYNTGKKRFAAHIADEKQVDGLNLGCTCAKFFKSHMCSMHFQLKGHRLYRHANDPRSRVVGDALEVWLQIIFQAVSENGQPCDFFDTRLKVSGICLHHDVVVLAPPQRLDLNKNS